MKRYQAVPCFVLRRLHGCGGFVVMLALMVSLAAGCAPPVEGPDKQFEGGAAGALTGAGAGAVTGFQVGAGTGPGALVGAGFGAVAGGVQGAFQDQVEEDLLRMSAETREERQLAQVRQVLQEHYARRLDLHPTRDIFPADLFFAADQTVLRVEGELLVDELAHLNKRRAPWSRLVVAVYVKSQDESSPYAQHLVERRARAIADRMAKAGVDPRRLETRPVIVTAPLVIDPLDDPERYDQAVELMVIDR